MLHHEDRRDVPEGYEPLHLGFQGPGDSWVRGSPSDGGQHMTNVTVSGSCQLGLHNTPSPFGFTPSGINWEHVG
ncbi:hypothetical protein P7K49_018742 [Saguinus oedipus]|uniref:Uncharacterized protein n=1 Tax=Saguinus oedipus TaxID=9490 RepID=A0ABQ9V6X9_SAGOE|nr:hypothetical protein P7K49_018742 [Saguinus oedipus]